MYIEWTYVFLRIYWISQDLIWQLVSYRTKKQSDVSCEVIQLLSSSQLNEILSSSFGFIISWFVVIIHRYRLSVGFRLNLEMILSPRTNTVHTYKFLCFSSTPHPYLWVYASVSSHAARKKGQPYIEHIGNNKRIFLSYSLVNISYFHNVILSNQEAV